MEPRAEERRSENAGRERGKTECEEHRTPRPWPEKRGERRVKCEGRERAAGLGTEVETVLSDRPGHGQQREGGHDPGGERDTDHSPQSDVSRGPAGRAPVSRRHPRHGEVGQDPSHRRGDHDPIRAIPSPGLYGEEQGVTPRRQPFECSHRRRPEDRGGHEGEYVHQGGDDADQIAADEPHPKRPHHRRHGEQPRDPATSGDLERGQRSPVDQAKVYEPE